MRPFTCAAAATLLLMGSACSNEPAVKDGTSEPANSAKSENASSLASTEEAAAPPVSAGAFGYRMGQRIEELNAKSTGSVGWFETTAPPRPNRLFPKVVIQATRENGVCFVKGVGENFTSDSNGLTVKSELEKLRSTLDLKYGSSEINDYLITGSIWDEPEDWMMALLKKERIYFIEWKPVAGNIKTVSIIPNALSTDTAFISVEYYFKNSDKCDEDIKRLDAASL